MSSWHKAAMLAFAGLACAGGGYAQAQATYPGIGRAATPQEVAAWDIDVRPDLKGLPAGSGSVAKGQEVWEAKCASCHGVFGESNEVFNPLVGGTTADDVKNGRVASLKPGGGYPGRTTLMKVAHVSTLWDYINRAMPWTQPKSLSVEEVYAATAYLLHLGGVLPADYVLSDKNMREVDQRLPNRNGMTTAHGLWPGKEFGGGKPDVAAKACMKDCATETTVASSLPAFARNAHGNLAQQNRLVGAQRGADTTAVAPQAAAPAA
jgi:cytochrome c